MKRDRAFNRDERGNIIYNDAAAAEMHTPFANASLRFYKLKNELERLIELRNRFEQTRPEEHSLDWGNETEDQVRREIRRIQNSLDQGSLDHAAISSDDSDEDPNVENAINTLEWHIRDLKHFYEPHFQEAQQLLEEDFKQELYDMGNDEVEEMRNEKHREKVQRKTYLRRRMDENNRRRNIIDDRWEDPDQNSYEDDFPWPQRQEHIANEENEQIWDGRRIP